MKQARRLSYYADKIDAVIRPEEYYSLGAVPQPEGSELRRYFYVAYIHSGKPGQRAQQIIFDPDKPEEDAARIREAFHALRHDESREEEACALETAL